VGRPAKSEFPTWEWALVAARANSISEAWDAFAERLQVVGFEVGALVYKADPDTIFPSESQLFGELISQDYVEFCRRPQAGDQRIRVPHASMRGHQALLEPDDLLMDATLGERDRLILEVVRDFGLTSGWTTPVLDATSDHFSVLALSGLGSRREFHRRLSRHRVAIARGTIHLVEGLNVGALVQQYGPGLLTARESDCLAWTSAGLSSKQVADRLRISTATVNEYLASAQRKLQCGNRTQAVARAILLGHVAP